MVEVIVIGTIACALAVWFFMGRKVEDGKVTVEVTLPEVEVKAEMPSDTQLGKMTKVKLEEFGRTVGVELDRRQTKANMIAELKQKS
jgi:hypothetical protein